MSVDNMTSCPRCLALARQKAESQERNLFEQYGKIPLDEWLIQQEKVRYNDSCVVVSSTLEEQWVIGIDTQAAEFSVHYEAKCSRCGFEFEHKYEQSLVFDLDPNPSDTDTELSGWNTAIRLAANSLGQ